VLNAPQLARLDLAGKALNCGNAPPSLVKVTYKRQKVAKDHVHAGGVPSAVVRFSSFQGALAWGNTRTSGAQNRTTAMVEPDDLCNYVANRGKRDIARLNSYAKKRCPAYVGSDITAARVLAAQAISSKRKARSAKA
jgi:hypothetical protein